jgi:hypothetical protein
MNSKIVVLGDESMPINEASLFINKMKRQNYTPFGMEFKKILSTQLFNYGTNFGIDIPVVGNILYRAFFEIELPVLSFNDSLITDIKYIQYKNNTLSNINNQITSWESLYSTMKNFSNIMIEVYVDVNKILKLQNITLSFLQSRVLNIINKYDENLYKYRLLIDTNILNNVDIAAYIINLTTLNISTISSTIEIMYNNNINYLNYYYGNINYYTKEYAKVKEGKILCSWIDNLGHYYFNFFELVVNGITIDNYSNDFLNLYQKHYVLSENLENYNKMIGNTEEIYNNKGSPNFIYTPLLFSFNNLDESSQSLPLVGMMNSNIKINSRVNDLKNLVYLQDWKSMFKDLKKIYLRRDQHTIDELNGIQIYDLPYDNIDILLPEYIYVYNCSIVDKRVLDAKYPGIDSTTILLEYGSFMEDGTRVLSEDDFIYFMNVIKTERKINDSSKIAIAGYHYFIDYNYVLNLIPKPKISLLMEYGYVDNYEKKIMAQNKLEYIIETHHEIILDINDTSLFDSLNDINGLVKDIYVFGRKKLNLDGISNYGKTEYSDFETDNISNIELNISNEYNLYDYYTIGKDTFNNIICYNLHSPLPLGIWYRTFSLYPYMIQPSGFINMNHIKGQNIAVIMNDTINYNYYNSKINPLKLGTEFKIIYTKYNIMKVNNGNIELVFYN